LGQLEWLLETGFGALLLGLLLSPVLVRLLPFGCKRMAKAS
jgi:hypothetical protein